MNKWVLFFCYIAVYMLSVVNGSEFTVFEDAVIFGIAFLIIRSE